MPTVADQLETFFAGESVGVSRVTDTDTGCDWAEVTFQDGSRFTFSVEPISEGAASRIFTRLVERLYRRAAEVTSDTAEY